MNGGEHWTARHAKPVIFVIVTLVGVGIYLASSIPVAVFPSTDFPRVVIGVDNGVAPIDQMLVTVTRPIEEAVNSVQGVERVQSITSRGTGGNRPVLFLESGHVPHAGVSECGAGAGADVAAGDGQGDSEPADIRGVSDHWLQSDVGHHPANAVVGDGDV